MLWNVWKCIFDCVIWFLILSNKVEKCLCIRFFCLSVSTSVHALIVVSILQMSLNLYMLFISNIEWTVLKMICIELGVRLQRRAKVFPYILAYRGKVNLLKSIITYLYYTKCNEIKYFSQLYKSMFRIQDHAKDFWYYLLCLEND